MAETDNEHSVVRYRSRSGLIGFGVWSGLLIAALIYTGWNALAHDEPPWLVVIWIAVILLLGWYWMSVQLTVTTNNDLEFRSLLRRRCWNVRELRTIRPGSLCMVFRFEHGSAMLATVWGREWLDLVAHIRQLNSAVSVVEPPAPFGRPGDGGVDRPG